jgi:hypothetical protein
MGLLWVASGASRAAEGGQQPVDLVLLVDVSKSMIGAQGAANIFGQVKAACKELIKDLRVGDTVTLISFGTSVQPYPTVALHSETERLRLFELIDRLQAKDDWTSLASALRSGLKEAERLEQVRPEGRRVVVLLTDGLNDPPPWARTDSPRLEEVAVPYAGKPWYVFYVQLGPKLETPLVAALKAFPQGKVVHNPGAVGLEKLPREIQNIAPPPKFSLRVQPQKLEVRLAKVDTPVEASLSVEFPDAFAPQEIQVQLQRNAVPEPLHMELVRQEGAGKLQVMLRAWATAKVTRGQYQANVHIGPKDPKLTGEGAEFTVPVVVVSQLTPSPWLFVLIAGLLVVAGVVFHQWRARYRLWGTLELWPARNPQDRQEAELARFGNALILGSQAWPLPGTAGGVAKLAIRMQGGRRQVVLVPLGNTVLRSGGRTVPELELCDGDVFELQSTTGAWGGCYRNPFLTR